MPDTNFFLSNPELLISSQNFQWFRVWREWLRCWTKQIRTSKFLTALLAGGMALIAPRASRAQSPQVYTYVGQSLSSSTPVCQSSSPGGGVVTATVVFGGNPSIISGIVNGMGNTFPATVVGGGPQNGQIFNMDVSGAGPQADGTNFWASVYTSYLSYPPPATGYDSVQIVVGDAVCNFVSVLPGSWSSVPVFQTQFAKTLGSPTPPPNPAGNSPNTPGPDDVNASDPNLGNCLSRGIDPVPNSMCGNPINAATGNKFQAETDFVGGASTRLSFTRYYNSQDGTTGGLGTGWHSTYHRGLVYAGLAVVVTRADGHQDYFISYDNGGSWTPSDPDVTSVLAPVASNGVQTGWTLTLADDSVENYTLNGRLTSIVTRAGLTTTLKYNSGGQLTTVTGPFGHIISFTYDASGRLSTMTVPGPGRYAYGYGTANTLASVTYPTRRYVNIFTKTKAFRPHSQASSTKTAVASPHGRMMHNTAPSHRSTRGAPTSQRSHTTQMAVRRLPMQTAIRELLPS